jgi:hypothetical protein
MADYEEYYLQYAIDRTTHAVVGVIVTDARDGNVIMNLPVKGDLPEDREEDVTEAIRVLLALCHGGQVVTRYHISSDEGKN